MKTDFQNAIKKAEFYAEEAVVITLSLKVASDEDKPDAKAITVEETCQAFLEYLQTQKIAHEILIKDKSSLTFAIPREEECGEFENDGARKIVAGFFKNEYQPILKSQAYYQKHLSLQHAKAVLSKPFSKIRRDINKRIKALHH